MNAIQRIAQALRSLAQLTTQIATTETNDIRVVRQWPNKLRAIGVLLGEAREAIEEYATEIEVYGVRHQEDAEAMQTIANKVANVATLFGKEGDNFELVLMGDPGYISRILAGLDRPMAGRVLSHLSEAERELLKEALRDFESAQRSGDS